MKRVFLPLIALGFCAGVLAKLPPLSPEAKAKADEAAAKTAWQAKVDAYRLCQVQDRVAAKYRESAAAAGKTLAPAVTTPPCTDPGPFVYTPTEVKPLEQAGAHSPAATAATPPVNTPQTQAEVKSGFSPATAASAPPVATAASGVAPAASSVPPAKP